MTHRLTTDCAKNYCNRTLIVKVIAENVVTFFGTKCRPFIHSRHNAKDRSLEMGRDIRTVCRYFGRVLN